MSEKSPSGEIAAPEAACARGGNANVRFSPEESFSREASFEAGGIDPKGRTCALSFSSEMPVNRGEYLEILSHASGDVDLSRLNGAHPVLLNHDPERQIGVIESAAIGDDKKGRAIVRFSKSPLGDEIWNDVKDGIRRLVSVGYRRVKELSSEITGGMETVRFAWLPYEISIVSVPADASVGVGRSDKKTVSQGEKIMIDSTTIGEQGKTRDIQKENGEILAIAKNLGNKVDGVRDLADRAITEGWTVDEFRAQALNKLPEVKPVQVSQLADVKARDWKKYSLSRAVAMQMPGSKRDGFEAEMDQELALKGGKRAEGLWIPDEVFSRNLVAGTGTLGGHVVESSVLANEFIEILRNKSQVMNLGARVLNLTNTALIPRQNGAGTANWVGETVASTLTAVNFQQLTLTPQAVSAYHQYSKMLLMEGNPSVDAIVRDDITQTLAIAIDLAALHGTGTGQPTGIASTTGIGTVALAANGLALGNATAYPALVSLESAVASANADNGSLGYLMRPAHRGSLRTAARFANSDTPVWDPRAGGVPVNGYRAEVSNQIATNLTTGTATAICSAIFFGNWNELLIGSFGSTDLVVDPYSAGANGVVRLYARRWVDIGVRHPASFAVLGGIL